MRRSGVILLAALLALGALAVNLLDGAPGGAGFALFRALLWLALFAVLLRPATRAGIAALALIAGFALCAHVDFGRFHGAGQVLHHHELFNYFIGSKYFAELGYDGHYLATQRALIENDPSLFREMPLVKNLETFQVEAGHVALQRSESVAARFTAERWREFQGDVALFQEVIPRSSWPKLVLDHGYNATPFWTAIGRLFSARLAPSRGVLGLLASLDLALLAVALALAWWGFGPRAALAGAIFYLAAFFGTFEFTGGAFLRQVWLACLVTAAACYRRGRPATAGVLLALAALDRVFPLLFFAAPLVDLARGGAARAAAARACAAAALVGAGAFLSLGPGAWLDCYANLAAHNDYFFINQISLRSLFLLDPLESLRTLQQSWDEGAWLHAHAANAAATRVTLGALRAVLCAGILGRMARSRPGAANLATAAFLPFVLLYPANYYGVFLILPVLFLEEERALALAVVLGQGLAYLLRAWLPGLLELELLSYFVSLVVLLTLLFVLATDMLALARQRSSARVALLGAAALLALALGRVLDRRSLERVPPAFARDLVAANVAARAGARLENQLMSTWGSSWWEGDHVSVLAQDQGALALLAFQVASDGDYDLRIELTRAPAYGKIAVALDDGPELTHADLFHPEPAARALVLAGLKLPAGEHRLALRVTGRRTESSGFHFGLDRLCLDPALVRTPEAAFERALAWLERHPADLFDGGRKDVLAELALLARLGELPRGQSRAGAIERLARARLALLAAPAGHSGAGSDWALSPEFDLFLAAASAARRFGAALPLPSRAAIEQAAREPADGRQPCSPAALWLGLARLDGTEALEVPASAWAALDGELSLNGGRDLGWFAREALALSDFGREPKRPAPLERGLLARELDRALGTALAAGDVLLAVRGLMATTALDLANSVPSDAEARSFLLAQQLADGSFGRVDARAPNPAREAVLAALYVFAAD